MLKEQKFFRMTEDETLIENMDKNSRFEDWNIDKTPLDESVKFEKTDNSSKVTTFPHSEGVGSSSYLSHTSRTEICYFVTQ